MNGKSYTMNGKSSHFIRDVIFSLALCFWCKDEKNYWCKDERNKYVYN